MTKKNKLRKRGSANSNPKPIGSIPPDPKLVDSQSIGRKPVETVDTAPIFSTLLQTVYQLTATDLLASAVADYGATDLFNVELRNSIATITDRPSLDTFLASLPSREEIEARVKRDMITEYQSLAAKLATIETERTAALVDPQIDEDLLTLNSAQTLVKQYQLSFEIPGGFASPKQRAVYKTKLVKALAKQVDQKTKLIGAGQRRLGDKLKVTALTGFDVDTLAQSYYHGGDEEDLALGSIGELVRADSSDRWVVRFSSEEGEKEWHLHPQEVVPTGENHYLTLLNRFKNRPQKLAEVVIAETEQALKPSHLQQARNRLNRHYDAQIEAVTAALVQKYDLTPAQLTLLRQGQDFEYRLADWQDFEKIIPPFNLLLALADRALTYKAKLGRKDLSVPADLNEASFKDKVLAKAQSLFPNQDLTIATEQMQVLAKLLTSEYDAVRRRVLQQPGQVPTKILNKTLESWIERYHQDRQFSTKFSFDRALLYQDRTIFTAEPFSPPSEELHRVLKLEVGNGCSYAKCTYCTEYGQAKFFIRSVEDFRQHARAAKEMMGADVNNLQRVFLAGGNVLVLPMEKLLSYVEIAKRLFHHPYHHEIRRIAAFTRTDGLANKSVEELNYLVQAGLNLVFWGLETGADSVLSYVNKGDTHDQMVAVGAKVAKSNMQVSTMIMTGLGGTKYYRDHVVQTAKLLNTTRPKFITFMSVNPKPWSPYAQTMAEEQARGENSPLSPEMVVEQMYDIVSLLKPNLWKERDRRCLVASYRLPVEKIASNPVEFKGRLEYGEQSGILRELKRWYKDQKILPSPLLSTYDFNRNSPLRKMAATGTFD